MIGTFSQIPYRTFAAAIAPISAVGLILTVVLIAVFYRREFIDVPRIDIEKPRVRVNTALLWKSVADGVERDPLQPGQQCPGSARFQAIHHNIDGSPACC
jgi:hypothetical protein